MTLTYSYVPDGTVMRGTTIQGNVIPETTSTLYSNLDWRFNGNRELWQSKIDSVFQRISGLTGVRFVRVGDDGASHPDSPGLAGVRGDIRIGMRYIDGNGTVLGYAGNDITLDTDEDWGYFGGNYFRLRNVMSHEVGHALGLAHVCPINRTKLMEPTVTGELDGPQHDDVRGLQKIYGDLYEPNDNAAVATPLGDSEPETTVEFFGRPFAEDDLNTTTASLCNTADQDVYQSFVGAPVPVSVTILPKGELYDSSPQSADATCQSGNFINSALYCRLSVAIYGADRVTLLGRADAPGAGYPVSLNNVSIPGGNYYIRVFTTDVNASMEPQMACGAGRGTSRCRSRRGRCSMTPAEARSRSARAPSSSTTRTQRRIRLVSLVAGTAALTRTS